MRPPPISWLRAFAISFVGWLAWFCFVAVALNVCCAPRVTLPSSMQAMPVAIVAWPSPLKPSCEIDELPESPPLPGHEVSDAYGNALERYYVNSRDVANMVNWEANVHTWARGVSACLKRLSEAPR